MKKLYASYGSNLHLRSMLSRCRGAKPVGTFVLPGYQLVFKGVADIVPAEGAEVPLALYEVNAADEVELDKYECFPLLYRKVNLEFADGSKAFVYLMNGGEEALPSPFYYNLLKEGYQDWGLPLDTLHDAYDRSLIAHGKTGRTAEELGMI